MLTLYSRLLNFIMKHSCNLPHTYYIIASWLFVMSFLSSFSQHSQRLTRNTRVTPSYLCTLLGHTYFHSVSLSTEKGLFSLLYGQREMSTENLVFPKDNVNLWNLNKQKWNGCGKLLQDKAEMWLRAKREEEEWSRGCNYRKEELLIHHYTLFERTRPWRSVIILSMI